MESIMGIVIVLNTITLGLSSELYPANPAWVMVDVCFAGIFTLEFALKLSMWGFRGYTTGADWRWNNFEMLLVTLSWAEVAMAMTPGQTDGTPKSSLFRILRLFRLAKLLRVLRLQVFCDLLMMLNGAVGSCKTLLYSMVLIFIPLYAISLLLKETLGAEGEEDSEGAESFRHLITAFFTMFRCIVAGECTQEDGKPIFVMVTAAHGWWYGVIYCLFQVLMTFGLFNVIVAIYVENTVSAAKFNDMFVKRQRLRDREYFEKKARALLILIWELHCEHCIRLGKVAVFNEKSAGQVTLTAEFFEELCRQSAFTDSLRDLDIAEEDQMDLFDTLDVEGTGSIDLMDFVIGIGKLRGEARKADIISVGLMLRSLQQKVTVIDARLSTSIRRRTSVNKHSSGHSSHSSSSRNRAQAQVLSANQQHRIMKTADI